MNFSVQFYVAADSASPATQRAVEDCEPSRLAEKLRDPLLNLVRRNYESLPPNRMGAPSTGYWRSAADSTFAEESDDGLSITTDKIGVRQHLYGGSIYPINAKFLSIPACIETHGKLPREFGDLVIAPLGRGQDAPVALVKASDASFVRNAPDAQTASSKVMFWLARSVHQQPELRTIPTNDQFDAAINEALKDL